MNRKVINYGVFAAGVLALAFAIIYIKDVIILNHENWDLSSRVHAEEMSMINEYETDRVINLYNSDQEIKTLIMRLNEDRKNQELISQLNGKLGIENEQQNQNWSGFHNKDKDCLIIYTGTGTIIMEVKKESKLGIKWASQLQKGQASLTIKDTNKEIVYSAHENHTSYQDEFVLQPGTYFMYEEVKEGVDVDYYYYLAKK